MRPDLVSLYQVDAMEQEFAKRGILVERVEATAAKVQLARAAKLLRLIRNIGVRRAPTYLAPVLRRSEGDLFPICYSHEVIPWSFDCWPAEYDAWEDFYKRIRVRLAFISARDSAAEMQRRLPDARIVWSPEATDPESYSPDKPLEQRQTAVLELGRRFPAFHEQIRPALRAREYRHLYEPTPGQKIFSTREALARGLGDSMVSICFPASMTHPEMVGGLETTTHRYFESMASKCVLFGHAPSELVDLFGYNPVVEASASDIAGHLVDILENLGDFMSLVERNYRRFLEVGTWNVRTEQILAEVRTHMGRAVD